MTDKTTEEKPQSTTIKQLVFISHDTRDAKLAEAFSNLLKSVSAGVLKSFRTSDKKGTQGIEYGVEWYPEIIKNIQEASDVVCLLTENSVNRPWILFEAGMAKGKLDTSILGVALGLPLKKASSGPFAQFQNCGDDEESLTKLVFQLVDRIPNSEPDEETIRFQVGKFKKNIEEILKKQNIEEVADDECENQDSSAKLFEEIKVMFQDLPSRIENNVRQGSPRKRSRHIHPRMIDEMIHMSRNETVGIMMALSLLKDSMPWIYDIGMETLRTLKTAKTRKEKKDAVSGLVEVIEMSTEHPAMREYFLDSKEDYMMLRELPMMLVRSLNHLI